MIIKVQDAMEKRVQELLSLWLEEKPVCTIELAHQILREYPLNFSVLNILGVALSSIDRFEEAHNVIKTSIRVAPKGKRYLAFTTMAFMYYQKGSYLYAEKWYEKSFAVSSPLQEDLVFISICLIKQGKLSKAKEYLLTSINKAENASEDAYYYYGVVLRANQEYISALKYFEEALRIDPSHTGANDSILDIKTYLKS